MTAIEAQLAMVEGDLAETIRDYHQWATLPGERPVWERTRVDLAALDEPAARALALSRENRDVEARQEMDQVGSAWARP